MSDETPMKKMNDSLSEIFDTEPAWDDNVTREDRERALSIIPDVEVTEDDEQDMEIDHQEVRKNIYHLIKQGHDALDYALLLAKDSDSARGFEVVAGLMKTIADMNAQLMDSHRSKKQTKNIGGKRMDDGTPKGNTTNNAIFVGSTTELSKMLESMNNKKG